MKKEDFTKEEWSFLQWMQRPMKMNDKNARKLIEELEYVIQSLKEKLKSSSPLEKNMIYCQIENKKTIIKWAEQYLSNKKFMTIKESYKKLKNTNHE